VTRDDLKGIKQNDYQLPEVPVYEFLTVTGSLPPVACTDDGGLQTA